MTLLAFVFTIRYEWSLSELFKLRGAAFVKHCFNVANFALFTSDFLTLIFGVEVIFAEYETLELTKDKADLFKDFCLP